MRIRERALAPVVRPRAARDLGLTDRYRYLVGRSGHRYLFTCVPADRLGDYRQAVVFLEAVRKGGRKSRPIWLGEIDRDGHLRGTPLTADDLLDRAGWVHLLARTARDRRAVLEDLTRHGPPATS